MIFKFLILLGLVFGFSNGLNRGKETLCDGKPFDSIALMDNNLLVFRGSMAWLTSYPGQMPDAQLWTHETLTKADATFKTFDKKILTFSGNQYWTADENGKFEGPLPITNLGFPIDVKEIDAAFRATINGGEMVYIFSGTQFWRISNNGSNKVDSGYPRSIAQGWPGVPDNLDAAIQWTNGQIYFFKNGIYWKYNREVGKVDEYSVELNTAKDWFRC